MSPTKKNSSSPAELNMSRWISKWFSGWTGAAMLCIVLTGIFIACVYAAWQKVGSGILASPEYFVGPQQLEITPPPPCAGMQEEIYQDLSRQGPLRVMDDDLVGRVADAFSRHPWVAQVRQVSKHHPAKVKVDLIYRRPVCMVKIFGELIPVDVEATLLPMRDFSPVEKAKYPQLVGVDRGPMRPFGRWGDSRVTGGAEIAAELLPLWEKLKLKYIVPRLQSAPGSEAAAQAGSTRRVEDYYFEIISEGEMRILWGHAPAASAPGESTPQQKVKKLEQFFAEHGSLDYPQGPRELDLRQP